MLDEITDLYKFLIWKLFADLIKNNYLLFILDNNFYNKEFFQCIKFLCVQILECFIF